MDSSWLQHADPSSTARDLTIEAAQAVSTARLSKSTSKSIPFVKLKALLDSRSDRDILEGLRKVISVLLSLPHSSTASSDAEQIDDLSV